MSDLQHTVFQANATYQVASGASVDDLMNDAAVMLSAVEDGLSLLATLCAEGVEAENSRRLSNVIAGFGCLAGMAAGICGAAHSQHLHTAGAVSGEVRHD